MTEFDPLLKYTTDFARQLAQLTKNSPLHAACELGPESERAVCALLDCGHDINERVPISERTPLFHAVHCNQVAVVRLLLERGADTSLANCAGISPLRLACCYQTHRTSRVEIVRLLLKHGASVHLKHDNTPELHHHVVQHYETDDDLAILRLLLQHGADFSSFGEGSVLCHCFRRGCSLCFPTIFDYASDHSEQLHQRVISIVCEVVAFPYVLDLAIAFAAMRLPPYVLLEIIDWLPLPRLIDRVQYWMCDISHGKKIRILVNIQRFQNRR